MSPCPQRIILQKRLEATFARISALSELDPELQADYARYLCILVSGYFETAMHEIAISHCRERSSPTVVSYADSRLRKFQNVNSEKLLQFLSAFEGGWYEPAFAFLEGEHKDALNSVIALRNKIAHGEWVGLTYNTVKDYYRRIASIVEYVEALFDA